MSTIIQPNQVFTIQFGLLVTKAATALPQTATATLFTVSGGSVLVTSLLGQVTTVIQNSDPVLTLGTAPTTGTADTDGIATTTALTSAEVGVWVTPLASSGLGGALVVGTLAGSAPWLATPFAVPAGTITWTTTASKTGALKWYLSYIPLDIGASVA
jgi:hypothetical protein